MCGIVGICQTDTENHVDPDMLHRMTQSIVHRGPDGDGYFIDGPVGLGHRRLSIIDLEGGDQPIYNEDRSLVIVFNGEIYNYKELRQKLLDCGHDLYTESDTEVIVRLYEIHGPQCLQHLNGMFAFAIWDSRKRSLFIARDRLGEKPLYYRHDENGNFSFSSELKALVVQNSDLSIDESAVRDYLAYGYIPAPRSIYKQVRKLPSAHFLLWENGRIRMNQYWSVDENSTQRIDSGAPVIEQLHSLLDDSVRLRLRSDVPVGAFLSGGIDSSLIVALASAQCDTALSTYSIAFEEKEFDESAHARVVAEHCKTKHRTITVHDLNLDMFPTLVSQFDEPFADPSALPTYYVTRAAADHVKVCLSGDAGDELFGGYPQYVPERGESLSNLMPAWLRRSFLGLIGDLLPDHARGKGWLRRMSVSGAERYQRTIGVFDSIERDALLKPTAGATVDGVDPLFARYFSENRGDIDARLRCDLATYLVDDILVKVDRTSMLNSLEVRVPLLDHRLVEFAAALPLAVKIRSGVQKWPLKELLRPLVPQQISARKKQGFGMPIRDWLRSTYKDLAQDLLLTPGNRSHDFLDAKSIRTIFDAHQKGSRDLSDRLWCLMWFEQWCRTFEA